MNLSELKLLTSELSVLYVEDDKEISEIFIQYLNKLFYKIIYKENGEKGLDSYKKEFFDIVITDIRMPYMDGLEMAKEIKNINPEQNILITSAYTNIENFLDSIKIGIDGYILKPIDFNNLNSAIYKVAKKIKSFKKNKEYENYLKKLAKENHEENIQLKFEKIDTYEKTLYALIDIIESRDPYTGKHSQRVAKYSKLIAQEMKLSEKDCEEIYKAGILHDIGKIAIPDSLLLKPSSLNNNEYKLIQEHVNIGFHMLEQIPMFKEIAMIINTHHERINGSGYPNALKENQIPLKGNIMALADAFDAMTTNRIYKGRKTVFQALEEIKSLAGVHYKKEIVKAAINVLKDIKIDNSINQLPKTTLEEERFSYFYKDSLTELFNEKYLDFMLAKVHFTREYEKVKIIFLSNFSFYNKEKGWNSGSKLLKTIALKLKELYKTEQIYRIHGDDFIILTDKLNLQNINHDEELLFFIKQFCEHINIDSKTLDIKENKIYSFDKLESLI